MYDAIYKDFRKGKFDTFLTELNLIYNEMIFSEKS
jgi:aldehyde dehydrogenase (NAD+)